MNSSVWRDVRSRNGGQSGSRDVIVGLRDGNRIWRVSPDRDRKPNTLSELWKKAQNIDAQHWECVQEHSREQNPRPPNQQKTQSSSSNNSSNNTSKPAQPNSGNNPQSSSSKSRRSKETPKTQSTKPDLTGKLDSKGKLTQQERQQCIDNNLCLFCGKPGHKVLDCPMKPASSAKGRASTSASTPAQGKDSTTELKKQ